MSELDDVRSHYAQRILAAARIHSGPLLVALANVPRERFLGPPPWYVLRPGSSDDEYQNTTEPADLYRDVLVAIDPARHLNNGQPSYLAFCLHALDLHPGDSVLHVGCGVGYYTAILAEVVGPAGHMVGVEVDADLARRARENLVSFRHVDVVEADGAVYDPGACDAIFVNAGATHLRSMWLDGLRPEGRLVLFLTTADDDSGSGKGGTLKVVRKGDGYAARFLSSVSVFHCAGSRDADANRRLGESFMRGGWQLVKSLRRDRHDRDDACWLHGDDFCLSKSVVRTPGRAQ